MVQEPQFSRRRLLRNAGLLGVVAVASPSILAACAAGDSDGGTETGKSSGAMGKNIGPDLAKMLNIDPANAGQGVTFDLGALLALSGAGSFGGSEMVNGIDLAVAHIAAAGGPTINVVYKDHKSGDAQAGQAAINGFASQGISAALVSYSAVVGAALAGLEQHKILALDGGGGTSLFAQSKPYFWGTRAIQPNDAVPGMLKYVTESSPSAKTVGFVGYDLGEPANSQIKDDLLAKFEASGLEFNGLYESFPIAATDYGTVLTKVQRNEPDVLVLFNSGDSVGYFYNQAVQAGIKAQIWGCEFLETMVKASKGTMDSEGFYFAQDYFDADNPISPLGKLFVSEYVREYGQKPDYYAANYYEDTLALWEIIRRVLAQQGDITRGEELNAALESNLEVVSVYGGDSSTVGSFSLDPTTHSVLHRQLGAFEYKNNKVKPLAYFDLDAAGYARV